MSRKECYLLVGNLNLRGERSLRPAQEPCKHLSCLVAIVVDGLLSKQNNVRRLLLDHRLQKLRHRLVPPYAVSAPGYKLSHGERAAPWRECYQRLQNFVVGDVNCAVHTHRKRRAERVCTLLRSNRDSDDLRHNFLHAIGRVSTSWRLLQTCFNQSDTSRQGWGASLGSPGSGR